LVFPAKRRRSYAAALWVNEERGRLGVFAAGADDDFDVAAEATEEVHEALDRETVETVMHER
jgi:flagellar biosynthesis/type III secretory pathway ATPase